MPVGAVIRRPLLRSTRRQPVFVRRIPSASGGPSTAPGGASRSVSAGRSSNMLKRLAALHVPWRAHSSTASAAASRSSSRRCSLVGLERREDVVAEAAIGRPDPDPQPAELLGAELVDDRAQAVVAARPAALAEAELAERQGEVVGDDEQIDSGACSRARTLRTARPDSFMNVRGLTSVMSRPRKRPIAMAEASRVRPLPSQPARSAIRSRTIQPMLWRVFAYWSPGLPRPTTIFTDLAQAHARQGPIPSGRARGDGSSGLPGAPD